ncbi:c-type heme family protein [Desulfobaculum sp.]
MKVTRPKKLQTKFLLGLAGIALGGGLLFACGLYFHLRTLLETEVASKADMMLNQVEAVRTYVRNTLRPAMYRALPEDQFIIEAMSTSYISRKVMDGMATTGALSPHYRRVAIGARNPNYEATPRERELVQYFQDHPGKRTFSGFDTIDGQQFYITARPVKFVSSCMNCHGEPGRAPKELIQRYGNTRGFGHDVDTIGGVTAVTLPVGSALSRIRGATLGYISLAIAGALLSFGIVNILFNRVVVHNLRRLTDVLTDHFTEQADTSVLTQLGDGDEIEDVLHGVEELASHLSQARRELEHYAVNLRQMVDDRTADLSREAMERRTDVTLFVNILNTLNVSHTRRELLEAALPRIGKRFNARKAAFVCTLASQNYYSWPKPGVQPQKPDNWDEVVASGEPLLTYDSAFIPVRSSEHTVEGYLCLYFDDSADTEPGQVRDILVALGQQLGIAMENLSALDTLLTQNDLLGSIFEGIADPLLLMDGGCNVIIANEAARALGESAISPQAYVDAVPPLFGLSRDEGDTCPLRSVIAGGQPLSFERELPCGRSFQISIYPVRGAEASDSRAVVYARENTAEKQMLAQMQQSEKLVTVGKLAAGLAHEINNPLGVIACYAELLRSGAEKDDDRADVDVILRHTKQAQHVLQDLLNFARPRSAGKGPSDPGEVLRMLGDVFTVQAEARHARLVMDVPDTLPPVTTDPISLEQVLSNLLINALDVVPRDTGEVRVHAEATPDAVRIVVADNGPGIPKDMQSQIFDPFFTTKDVGKGTGLGLAVVFGLMRDIGGTITVHSDGGARFTLTFPISETADDITA